MEIKRDSFNSEIFKKNMGNILYESVSKTDMEKTIDFEGFEHLTIKIPSSDKATTNYFLQNGFRLSDTLVRYVLDLKDYQPKEFLDRCNVRKALKSDVNSLAKLAKSSFKIDRFHSDPTLDDEDCDTYYEQWVKNSCQGFADVVLVAEYQGKPVGFTTGKIYPKDAVLVLSAVDTKARGLGIYTTMIKAGIGWALKSKKSTLIVGTQIDNIAVQKAWIKLGFTVYDSQYVLQKGRN